MSIIGNYLYEAHTDNNEFEDYVIVPPKYKFNTIQKKLRSFKEHLQNDFSNKEPDSFKKIGKIIDVKVFFTFKYNIGFNGIDIDIQPYHDIIVLIVQNTRGTLKYFDISGSTNKLPYYKGEDLIWTNANEYSSTDIKLQYTPFLIDDILINDKYANYFLDLRNVQRGYCFEGNITIPVNDELYNEYIDIIYNPKSKNTFIIFDDYKYEFDYKYNQGFDMTRVFESNYQMTYKDKVKNYIYNHIMEYFEMLKEEQIITIENIVKKLKISC